MDSTEIIFLCYMNRSGSTYLANLLSKSPDICVCPESDTLVELFLLTPWHNTNLSEIGKLRHAIEQGPKLHAWKLPGSVMDNLPLNDNNFSCFIYLLQAYREKIKPGARIIVFKSERLIELYKAYNRLSPSRFLLKWVVIIRDVRAVYYSQRRTSFPGSLRRMSTSPVKTAVHWLGFIKKSLEYSKNPGFIMIRYEDLISNQEHFFTELLSMLNVRPYNFMTSKGDLLYRLPESHRIIHKKIDDPPDDNSQLKWEAGLKQYEIAIIQNLTSKYMEVLNYPLKIYTGNLTLLRLMTFVQRILFRISFFFRKLLFKFKL